MDIGLCDNCKRQFEPFEMDNGGTAYSFAVPKENDDPVYFLSNMTENFLCCTEPNPTDKQDVSYWCVKCIENIGGDDGY